MDWFTAHKGGLRQIAKRLVNRRGFGIVGGELYQNVMDTDATECEIKITKVRGCPLAELMVRDDNPTGFTDLTHAWTVFAPSEKKENPTKAGRFNIGEKVVLSLCKEAEIRTTKGTVIFNGEGRKEYPRRKLEYGTLFTAQIECTQEWYDQFLDYMDKIIVRPGLRLIVNGGLIPCRKPVHDFICSLQTEIGEDLRPSKRKSLVEIYEPQTEETPTLYELGIPVVETGDRWHYNVMQKVPLNIDRDNVTPSYLQSIRTVVFNEMFPDVSPEDTTSSWVQSAASDPQCSTQAVTTFLHKKYGEKSVASDPTNPEANAMAVAEGYTLIPARGLSKGQRDNLKQAGKFHSSSSMFPTAGKGAFSDDPNAPEAKRILREEWSPGMKLIHDYTEELGSRLLHRDIYVHFVHTTNGFGAAYGEVTFYYNVFRLGRKWFDNGITDDVDALIIHEFGHHYESNHLSEDYYKALCKLGARLKALALKEPEWFAKFERKD